MNEWLLIGIVILLSGFFAGSEMGFVSANRLKLELRARKDTFKSRTLARFLRDPESFLSTTLVGNNIVNVLYATLMAVFLAGPITVLYLDLFGVVPSEFLVLFIQTLVAGVLIMIFGEIIPKVIFRINSEALIYHLGGVHRVLHVVFMPFIVLANTVAARMLRLVAPNFKSSEAVYRRQDIEMLLREIGDNGNSDIDRDDSALLTKVLQLSNKRVKESMIPRTEMEAVDKGASLQQVLQKFVSTGFSKLPVYEDSIDNIIGVVFAYDLFQQPENLSEIIRPVKHIPSSQKSKDLLADFRKLNISMAIVIDEYGGTAGLITIEDLLEEVVGDIQDEYDMEEVLMKKIAPGTFVLSGDVPLDELNEKFPELQLPSRNNQFETLAGYIIHETGRIPGVNDEVLIGNHKFIISKASPSRIRTVKLTLV